MSRPNQREVPQQINLLRHFAVYWQIEYFYDMLYCTMVIQLMRGLPEVAEGPLMITKRFSAWMKNRFAR